MYEFFVVFVEGRTCVGVRNILNFCPIYRFDVRVRLVLRFAWSLMLKSFESICYICEHGEMDFVVNLVSIKIETRIV